MRISNLDLFGNMNILVKHNDEYDFIANFSLKSPESLANCKQDIS